jgi:hypothetical protein
MRAFTIHIISQREGRIEGERARGKEGRSMHDV